MICNNERPSLLNLAERISASTSTITSWLKENNLPPPSLAPSGPTHFPPAPAHIHAARDTLLESTRLLHLLAHWPQEACLLSTFYSGIDAAAMRWLEHFNVAAHVPLEGSVPYFELAEKADVPEDQLKRVLRQTMTGYFFAEPEEGRVAHTAISSMLVKDPPTLGQVVFGMEVIVPSAMELAKATETASRNRRDSVFHAGPVSAPETGNKSSSKGQVTEASHTASPFNMVFKTDEHAMQWTASRPELSKHFGNGMRAFQQNPWYDVRHVINGFDWARLRKGHVVDVGGNDGAVAIALAGVFPELKFTVQDLPQVIEVGQKTLPAELKEKVTFQAADFLQDNTVKDADVYLLKNILHDWPDADAIKILKAQMAGLKPLGRIVVADTVLGVGDVGGAGRWNRAMDLAMWSLFNGRERSRDDFERLVAGASDRQCQIKRVWSDPGSVISLVEIGRKDETASNVCGQT